MKVLLIAFGHPDNVLSLSAHLSRKVDLTLILVVPGEKYEEGVLSIDVAGLEYGLNPSELSVGCLPMNIGDYLGNRITFQILRTQSRKILKDYRLKNIRQVRSACLAMNRASYDVVHYNGTSGFIIYFLLFLKISKRLWTIHDYKSHSGEKNISSFYLQRILSKMNFHFIQHYKFLKKAFQVQYRIPSDKVFQVYSGKLDIFLSFNPANPIHRTGYILFFGRVSIYKGIDILIQTFVNVLKKEPSATLVIAGKGDLWFDMPVLPDPERIVFLNQYLESEEIAGLVRDCSFIVLPYRDATHSAVLATAYAFNKPVISTDVGGLSEVIVPGKTGRVVPPEDTYSLEKEILNLIRDQDSLEKMSAGIEEVCEHGFLSWDKITRQMEDVYYKIANK